MKDNDGQAGDEFRGMRDSDGKKQTGRDSDISWSVCIGGKWYVVPNVDEERTED